MLSALLLHLLFLHPASTGAFDALVPAIADEHSPLRDAAPNIWMTRDLTAIVDELWRDSPTFRAQCARIGRARPGLQVAMAIDPWLRLSFNTRATATIRRYSSGFTFVRVSLPVERSELEELIPHELEHIIEYLEGIDLTGAAQTNRGGYYLTSDRRVETDRAIAMGRRVRRELGHPLLTRR